MALGLALARRSRPSAPAACPGTLVNTLLYVVVGVAVQFLLGLGLALLCGQPIRGRNFFRVLFFIPLMVTPVGIAYTFRMLADMQKGPFAPLVRAFGISEWSWATEAWSARLMVLVGDTWQWTPFMFIVLLAAIENQPRDQVEAARLDGASGLQIFRDITWPAIAPIAATVVLIRLIEAFKIIDLPNVLTGGGPGLATESMTLHSFIAWRTQDLGGSAAVGYMLLFVSTVVCVSFFNFVVRPGAQVRGMSERRARLARRLFEPPAIDQQAPVGEGRRPMRCCSSGRWSCWCRSTGCSITSFKGPGEVDNGPFYIPFVDFTPSLAGVGLHAAAEQHARALPELGGRGARRARSSPS